MSIENYRKIFSKGASYPNRSIELFDGLTNFDKYMSDIKSFSKISLKLKYWLFNSRTALHFILMFLAVLQICILTLKHVNIDRLKKFTQCFEYKKSFLSLFDHSEHKDEISSMHGIKVLACFSVIMYHSVMWRIVDYISLSFKHLKMNTLTFNQIDFMAASVVEPFFVMSGILTARSVIKELKR